MGEAAKNSNTEFWKEVIKDLTFDHPEQKPARRGGTNTIRVSMPSPFKWVTAWRDKEQQGGIFLRMEINPLSSTVNQFFIEHLEVLRDEVHKEIKIEYNEDKKGWEKAFFISFRSPDQKVTNETTLEVQKDWYVTYLNKFVTSSHPLIRKFNQIRL